jgi:hypothetical protein
MGRITTTLHGPEKIATAASFKPTNTVIYHKFGTRKTAAPKPTVAEPVDEFADFNNGLIYYPPPPRPLIPLKPTHIVQAAAKAEKAVAIFATEYQQLRKLVGAEAGKEISADLANSTMLRAFLNVILNAIPVAERSYLNNGGVNSAYALSTLVNNAREIARDIAAKNSLEHQVNHILSEIISPALRLILHQQILNMNNLGSILNNDRSPKALRDAINKSMEGTAQILTDIRNRLDTQLREYLLEK